MHRASILRVSAELAQLETIRFFIEEQAAAIGVIPSAIYDVLLAVDELATNIIVHGYPDAPGPIELELRPAGSSLEVLLRDAAATFDPTTVPTPDTTLPLELRQPGGMGIHLVRHFVDSIAHRALPQGGNELTLVKRGVVGTIDEEDTDATDG